MSLVYTHSPAGLVVASHGSGEAEAARALRDYDSELRLIVQGPDEHGPRSYRVYRYMGSERPIQFVCGWWDEYLQPYRELSVTGLLELVRKLDLNTRGEVADPNRANRELVEQRREAARAERAEIASEFAGRLEGKRSSILPPSRSRQLARQRQRAKNPSLYE